MSIKHNFRGAAIGIFLTTSIFASNYYLGNSSQSENTLSAEDAISLLESESFIILEEEEYRQLSRELRTLQEQVDQLVVDDQEEENENVEEADEETETETDESDSAEESEEEESTEEEIFETTVVLESGMTSADVVNQLIDANIISEGGPLVDYLVDNGIEQSIKIGEHNVRSDMSIAEIAEELITY